MPTLPQRLHPGDLLGLICPASAPPDPKTVDASVTALEEMGFKVRLGRNARKRWGFLAGQDREQCRRKGRDRQHAAECIYGHRRSPR